MDSDNEACCCAKSAKRQEAKLRRAIEHDNVVTCLDRAEHTSDAPEKQRAFALVDQGTWGIVLELHQLQITGNEIDPRKVSWTDNV